MKIIDISGVKMEDPILGWIPAPSWVLGQVGQKVDVMVDGTEIFRIQNAGPILGCDKLVSVPMSCQGYENDSNLHRL